MPHPVEAIFPEEYEGEIPFFGWFLLYSDG